MEIGFFFLSLWPSYGERHHCFVCVDVWTRWCGSRACCAAFEATRFYNVSESSPLARELCDGPTCNEVESSTNQWIGKISSASSEIHWHPISFSLWILLGFLLCRFCAGKPMQQCVWLSGGGAVWALHLLQGLRLWWGASLWVGWAALPEPVSDGGVCLSKWDTHQAGSTVPVSSQ